MSRFLLPLLVCFLGVACSSTSSRKPTGDKHSARVTLRDYRIQGLTLSIVSDGYIQSTGVEGETTTARRAAYYSSRRADALTKVADDEVVLGVIEALDREGFLKHATSGTAPERSGGSGTSLEVIVGDQAQYMLFDVNMERAAQESYRDCTAVFREIYNRIYQYQSADPDEFTFDGARPQGN